MYFAASKLGLIDVSIKQNSCKEGKMISFLLGNEYFEDDFYRNVGIKVEISRDDKSHVVYHENPQFYSGYSLPL